MDIYERESDGADMDMRREEDEMKGIEVPEMKYTRTMSPSSSTCDPFHSSTPYGHPSRTFVSGRRLAWDKGSGHGDDSNRILLSAIFIRPARSSPRERGPRAPSSSCGESCSWEFSPILDGRMRTRSERDRVIRFNLHTEKSSVEFRVRVETGNISRSRIEVSGAFLRGIIVLGLFRQNKYNIAKYS